MKKAYKLVSGLLLTLMFLGSGSGIIASANASESNKNNSIPETKGIGTYYRSYYFDKSGYGIAPQYDDYYFLSDAFNEIWKKTGCWKGYVLEDSKGGDSYKNMRGVVLSIESEFRPVNIDFNGISYTLSNGGGTRNNKDYVKGVQQALVWLGYNIGSSGIDGGYGPSTENAIIQFQKNKGITADGIVGKQTYYWLAQR